MIYVAETRKILVNFHSEARSFLDRLKGLIGTKRNDDFGFIIPLCFRVHTYFMSYNIDIIFFDDDDGIILKVYIDVPPNRFLRYKKTKKKDVSVLECPAGSCSKKMEGKKLMFLGI